MLRRREQNGDAQKGKYQATDVKEIINEGAKHIGKRKRQ